MLCHEIHAEAVVVQQLGYVAPAAGLFVLVPFRDFPWLMAVDHAAKESVLLALEVV